MDVKLLWIFTPSAAPPGAHCYRTFAYHNRQLSCAIVLGRKVRPPSGDLKFGWSVLGRVALLSALEFGKHLMPDSIDGEPRWATRHRQWL